MMTRSIAIVVMMFWGWPAAAYAQADAGAGVAASFEQLQVLVRPGNTVTVTDAAGSQVSGRLESLSSSLLSLSVDGNRRDFNEADVTTIRQRRGDSLANGAWWGFGISAGLAVVAFSSCDECWDSPGFALGIIAGQGAMGAGVGVAIDALIRGQHTIYRRPAGSAAGLTMSARF
jgi:hypothetical protein